MKTSSKRRRTKQEIKDQKAEVLRKQKEIDERLASFDAMQFQMNQMQEQLSGQQDAVNDISMMFDQGLLKRGADGSYQVVEDQEEREFIQQSNRKERESQHQRELEEAANQSERTENPANFEQRINLQNDEDF